MVPDHVGRLQVFVIDRVVLSNERQRRFVVKILSLATYLLMRLGQQHHRHATASAAFLATSYTPLRGFQRPFCLPVPSGGEDARALGEGSKRLNAKVNTGLLSSGGKWMYWHIGAGEADIPPIRFSAERDGLTELGREN